MPASAAASHRGLPEEVGHRCRDLHPRRRDPHHALRLRACAQSRPRKLLTLVTKSNAQRHGMVMWDDIFDRGGSRISRCRDRQDAGRCRYHPHGAEAAVAGHDGGDQPACRHLERSGGGACRQPRHRAHGQLEPGAGYPRCSSPSTVRPSTSWARDRQPGRRRSGRP